MQKTILGIDIGTTALKVAVFSVKGEQLASATIEYSLLTPSTNFVEAPCEIYMDSIRECMRIIRDKHGLNTRNVGSVSFSVQGETLCFVDEHGKLVGLLTYRDITKNSREMTERSQTIMRKFAVASRKSHSMRLYFRLVTRMIWQLERRRAIWRQRCLINS